MSDLYLYVYDLSKGMARQFSAMFLGKHFDGVWHTGVVAFGNEWYFGNDGISCCPPKGTILGEPNEMIKMGKIELSEEDFLEIVRQMSDTSFKVGTYNLLEHNCNNFSNELSMVLVGKPIPQHILDLPKEILNTSLGPMLRPLLEQAADPVHQIKSGHTPLLSKIAEVTQGTTPKTSSNGPKTSKDSSAINETIPVTAIIYKPLIQNEIDNLLEHVQSLSLVKLNEYNLLVEIKEYLQQSEIKWSIAKNHVKLMYNLYLNVIKSVEHKLTILKIFQLVAVHPEAALLIMNSTELIEHIVPHIKETSASDVQYLSFQMLSNVCMHSTISKNLLEKNQEIIFKHLSEFTLAEANTDIELLVHEASLSFFYNLVAAYHFEKYLDDNHALVLGVALLERLPKAKCKPKTIYHMLALLRSCLSKSQNTRELAQSLNFDSSKFRTESNNKEEASANNGEDSYDSVLKNINDLIQPTSDK